MNITKENIDPLNAIVKIQLAPEDYVIQVEDQLKTLRKKVELKGFRKGQTPVGLVKKMYGNSVLLDELNKIINQELGNYLKTNEVEVLGNPIPKENLSLNIDINTPQPYEFEYEIGISPEFKLELLSKSTNFNYNRIKPDEETINKEIEQMRKRFGKMINPDDDVLKDDVLYGDWAELNADGSLKENGHQHTTAFPVDMITDEATQQKLLQLKVGEAVSFDIYAAVNNKTKEEVAKHFLNLDSEAINSTNSLFQFNLKRINRVELAELNEEFFNTALGPDKATNEEEFKNYLSYEISKYFDTQTKKQLHNEISDAILKQTEIPLPDEFLKRWIRLSNEKPLSEEEVTTQYPDFAKNLKWRLIINKLVKQNNIQVTDEELKAHTKKGLQQYLSVADDMMHTEEYENWVNKMMENKEHMQRTFDVILEEKLFDYIESQVTITDKQISIDDFKSLNEAQ